jgi:hypothetical protein
MQVTRSVLLLAGAVVAGVLGAKLAHRRHDSETMAPPSESAVSSSSKESVAAAIASAKMANLEARLAAVEGTGQSGDTKAGPLAHAAHVDFAKAHSPEERERRIAADYSNHLRRIEDHKTEPRDEVWAQRMETSVTGSLGANHEGASFRYEGVECRKNTCVANVSWPSRGSADGELRKLVSSLVTTGCSREIYLAPDNGGGGPTQGSVLLTCTNAAAE